MIAQRPFTVLIVPDREPPTTIQWINEHEEDEMPDGIKVNSYHDESGNEVALVRFPAHTRVEKLGRDEAQEWLSSRFFYSGLNISHFFEEEGCVRRYTLQDGTGVIHVSPLDQSRGGLAFFFPKGDQ